MPKIAQLVAQLQDTYLSNGWLQAPYRPKESLVEPCTGVAWAAMSFTIKFSWPTGLVLSLSKGFEEWALWAGYSPLHFAQRLICKHYDPDIQQGTTSWELPIPAKGDVTTDVLIKVIGGAEQNQVVIIDFDIQSLWNADKLRNDFYSSLNDHKVAGFYTNVMDAQWNIIELEGNGFELVGLTRADLLGKNLTEVIGDAMSPSELQSTITAGVGTFTVVYGDYNYECLVIPKLDVQGNVLAISGFHKLYKIQEDTAHKPTFMEGVFNNLLKHQKASFMIVAEDGAINMCSDQLAKLLGFSGKELPNFLYLIDENKKPGFRREFSVLLTEGKNIVLGFLPIMVNDEYLWFNLKALPDQDGYKGEYLVYLENVTEAYKDLSEKKRTEILLQAILNQGSVGILVTDMALKTVKLVNESLLELFNLPDAQAVEALLARIDLLPEDNPHKIRTAKILEALSTVGNWSGVISVQLGSREVVYESAMYVFEWENQQWVLTMNNDITEKTRMQRKVDENEARFETFFNATGTPTVIYDIDTLELIQVNKAAMKLYGYTDLDIPTFRLWHLWPKQEVEKRKEAFLELNFSPDSFQYKTTHVSSSGKELIVYVFSSRLPDALYGRRTRLATAHDITESELMTKQLNDQGSFLRELLNNMPYPVFLKDSNLRYILVNKQFLVNSGFAYDEVIGKTDYQLFGVNERTRFFDKTDNDVLNGQTVDYELEETLVGAEKFSFTNKRLTKFSDQRKVILGVTTDITIRRHNEMLLKQRERLFVNLFESSADALFVVNGHTGVVSDCNMMAIKLLHVKKKSEVVGANSLHFFENNQTNAIALQVLFGSGQDTLKSQEMLCKRLNGDKFWASVAISYLDDAKESSYLLRIEDVTEQKMLMQQLEGSIHEKEVLLREIHHRVKNNLAVIVSMLSLQSVYTQDTKTKSVFMDAMSRIRSMAILHEELYRADNLGGIDMLAYVNSLSMHISRTIQAQKYVQVKVGGDGFTLDIIKAVPLGLIINELLTNSFKHAFGATAKPEISVTLSQEDGMAEVRFQDNGVGKSGHADATELPTLGQVLILELSKQIKAITKEWLVGDGREGYAFQLRFSI